MNKFIIVSGLWIMWVIFGIFVFHWRLLMIILGFGLAIIVIIFTIICKKLNYIHSSNINSERLNFLLDIFKFFVPVYYSCFALYSAFLLYLANTNIFSLMQNMLWLILLIFVFQLPPIIISLYMISKNFRAKHILYTFLVSYGLLSFMFGYTSAHLTNSKIWLSISPDLIISAFVPIIMLVIFYYLLEYIKK